MIRVALISKHYQQIQALVAQLFVDLDIEYTLSNYRHQNVQDIYFVEIEKAQDLVILKRLKRMDNTLVYIIGPKDFDIVSTCLTMTTHLYLLADDLPLQISKYQELIQKQISKNFRYYISQRYGIISKIRLSHIYYIESLRYQVIIHSLNGEVSERKTLAQMLQEIDSRDFIQIHKSYIVNRKYIEMIKSHEIILKNKTVLPVGRSYKNALVKNKQG